MIKYIIKRFNKARDNKTHATIEYDQDKAQIVI